MAVFGDSGIMRLKEIHFCFVRIKALTLLRGLGAAPVFAACVKRRHMFDRLMGKG